ncbi:POK6 protein, partial [Pedionomus torquatus]|nr:POK6 protein [Pedionomus torquatus]
ALSVSNAKADFLVSPAWRTPSGDILSQARQSHNFFHQSAKVLHPQFHISLTNVRDIVASCPRLSDLRTVAINCSLGPLKLWQMHVTHIPEFGRFRYTHVTIDFPWRWGQQS